MTRKKTEELPVEAVEENVVNSEDDTGAVDEEFAEDTEAADIPVNNGEMVVEDGENTSEEADGEEESKETTEDDFDDNSPAEKTPSRREHVAQNRKYEKERAEKNELRENTLMNWEGLKSARHERRILKSRIIAVETLNEKTIVAVLMVGGFRVIIPYSEMYVDPPIDKSTLRTDVDRVRREKQILDKLLGSEINFIITEISGIPDKNGSDANAYAVIASRKEAIAKIAARNFNKRRFDGQANVNIGDIVEATIISVGMHAIWVNVKGFDVKIEMYRLTHQYIDDCRNNYEPGQTIKVYISDIDYDVDGVAQSIVVSAKAAEVYDFIPRLKNIKSGMHILGTITSISKSKKNPGQTNIRLFLNSFNVPAIAVYAQMIDTMATPPRTGDVVVFSVHSVKEERGYVIGSIMRRA